jgi:hypothetical protein
MDIGSALLAMAQVAVGLIGFSSVLVALSGEPSRWSALDSFRIKGMLASAIILLLLSLVPFLLQFLGLAGPLVWRCSTGLLAGLLAIGMIANLRAYLRLSESYRAATRPLFVWSIYGVGVLVLVAESTAAAGLLEAAEGTYFLGLFFMLALSSYLIVRFLFARPNR